MGRLAAFNSAAVDVIMVGIPIDDGRAAEDFLVIEGNQDDYEDEEGAEGFIVRYDTGARLYKVTIKLKGSSNIHQKLTAIRAIDKKSKNGAGVLPYAIKDNNGATLVAGSQSWIKGPPKGFGMGTKRGDVTWEFRIVADPEQIIFGGN